MQRRAKRMKVTEKQKHEVKDSKVVIKQEGSKKARIEALNYLVLWNRSQKE